MKERWKWTTIFVRLLHTSLTLGVAVSLIFADTSIRKAVIYHENLVYAIGFFCLLLFSLLMYWVACTSDPGFVPRDLSPRTLTDEDEEITLESAHMLSNGIKLRRCGFCDIEQPLRARHCEDCDRCVRKYDHHCPWLDKCVGEGNHRYFWLFLLSKSAVIIWAAFIIWHSFAFKDSVEEWLKHNAVLIIDMFILVFSGFVVICLTGVHTYLMITGATTWEVMARDRITYLQKLKSDDMYNPFHEGYYKNVFYFLCKLGIRQWEKLYDKKVNAVYSKKDVHLKIEGAAV